MGSLWGSFAAAILLWIELGFQTKSAKLIFKVTPPSNQEIL